MSYDFYTCSGLTTITIPRRVRSIDYTAFRNAPLSSITVDPDNQYFDSRINAIVETTTDTIVIGSVGITIPEGIKGIGQGAFYGRRMTSIVIPKSVVTIGANAFQSSNPTSLVFSTPSSLVSIGDSAFSGQQLPNGYSLEFPEGLTTVGSYLFTSSQVTMRGGRVVYPSTITSIGSNSLVAGNNRPTTVIVKAAVPPTYSNSASNMSTVSVYVPDASVNDYKSSQYWSNLAGLIKPMSEYDAD